MRKLLILLFIVFMILPAYLFAGIYGTIKGTVKDTKGNPVLGATIRVVGTLRGANVANPNGSFTIVNIDAGKFIIKVSRIGYEPYEIKNVVVSADNITHLNIVLKEKGVTTKTVVVTAQKIMVRNSAIGQQRTMSKGEMENVAREGIDAIISLTPGVIASGRGYSVRGSRPEDTQIRVDGLDVSNQFTGGGRGLPSVSQYDTEEIQVLTGGFSAEYGGAMGGIVNTMLKRGRTDRYEGYVRYRTDLPSLNGSQASGKKLVYNDSKRAFEALPSGNGAQLQGPGQNRFTFGTGGPLPYLKGSTFYISTNYTYRKFNGANYQFDNRGSYLSLPAYKIFDPWGNNLGQLPNNQSWNKNLEARLRFAVAKNLELNFGGSYGSHNWESSSWNWLYANDEGWLYDTKTGLPLRDANNNIITNGMPERAAKQTVANNFKWNAFVRINQTLSETSYYEFTISNSSIIEEYSKRKNYSDPNYFTGFDVWYPQDNLTVKNALLKPGHNKIVDQYEVIKRNTTTSDGYSSFDINQRDPLTGYIEGASDATGTNNPWGRSYAFNQHGNTRTFEFRNSNIWAVDGNFTKNFEGKFSHMFKTGLEFKYFTLRRHMNSLPWDGNPFFDVYTNQWGGDIYADNAVAYERTSKAYNPMKFAAYALDQISYKGIIISPGLRLDLFMPQSDYRTIISKFVPISSDSGFAKATLKYQVSPRINVTYPITERSNISINYGLFFQMPTLSYLYDAFAVDVLRGNNSIGNPNMEAQRTNAYEVNYANQLTDQFALTISAYYKDIYNQLGQVYVPAVPVPFYLYSVSEYGNIKGMEFTLQKRYTMNDPFGFRLNYTLQQSVATSSSPGDNYNRPVDPYSNLPAFPLATFPTRNDIRNRAQFIFDLVWGDNQGPSIGGIPVLENTNLDLTATWRSGVPYTKTDLSGTALGEIRTERGPSMWTADFQIGKKFYLRDWFGDSFGRSMIEFELFVYNIFNFNGPVGLYTSTGDADDRGLAFRKKMGDFSSTPYYKNADFSNVSTFNSSQYDNYGNRLYSKEADADGNGIVSQKEKFDSYIRQLETNVAFQGNYQSPRSVFLSIYFRFN